MTRPRAPVARLKAVYLIHRSCLADSSLHHKFFVFLRLLIAVVRWWRCSLAVRI